MRVVVEEAGVAQAGQRRDRGLRRARVGVAELAGRLPLAGLEGIWRARAARRRGEVQLSLSVSRDALAADSTLRRVGGAKRREHEAGRARRRAELRRKRVARAGPAGLVCRGVLEAARVYLFLNHTEIFKRSVYLFLNQDSWCVVTKSDL